MLNCIFLMDSLEEQVNSSEQSMATIQRQSDSSSSSSATPRRCIWKIPARLRERRDPRHVAISRSTSTATHHKMVREIERLKARVRNLQNEVNEANEKVNRYKTESTLHSFGIRCLVRSSGGGVSPKLLKGVSQQVSDTFQAPAIVRKRPKIVKSPLHSWKKKAWVGSSHQDYLLGNSQEYLLVNSQDYLLGSSHDYLLGSFSNN